MITLYGINNCDTIKKARRWLDDNGVEYTFHDYKKSGIDRTTLAQWCHELGYQVLLNTRGTTWRKLDETDKTGMNEKKAIDLMLANNSLIKRPVLVAAKKKKKLVGFDKDAYKSLL